MGDREIGTPMRRREDADLVTGRAQYTDDMDLPGMAHAAILRSQYGHARLESIDVKAAASLDGVLGVFTGADLAASDAASVIEVPAAVPNAVETGVPVLATDTVRYTGEAIAIVVAEDRYVAADAADLIEVEYDRLDAVVDGRATSDDGSPVLHGAAPDNVAFDWEFGDEAATDDAFADADRAVDVELSNQRLIGDPMEPRAVLAEYDADDGLTVTLSTQTPYGAKAHLASTLSVDQSDIRVIAPAVGGGFGIKGHNYAEEVAVAWAAMELSRPVKWTSTRSEGHRSDVQSRDWHIDGELALNEDGMFRGVRVTATNNIGAYYGFTPSLTRNFMILSTGQYSIPTIHGRMRGVFTNTAPVAPYRGAGRPEAMYFLERLVYTAARDLNIDPAELRRRNQIAADEFPYETPAGSVYDSGDYTRALDIALERVDYDTLRERQAALRDSGRYLGIGLSCFVENSGSSPGMGETGRVRVTPDGRVTAYLGTHDHGQGHGTTFAQILADELGIGYDDIDVEEGDTRDLSDGTGTFGSRSVALGGSAIHEAANEVKDRAKKRAATALEADSDDLEFIDGAFRVTGAPHRSIHLGEIAATLADDGEPLEASSYYDPPNYGFSFGTHLAVVEVDPATGEIEFERYLAVDDCGVVINPLIVTGQIHGGVAQGIAQALYEEAVYDENGQLVTGSLQDYALPKAFHIPEMETEETVTPSPHNPLGVKGTGESGTIAATPAVVNAVVDALEPFGVDNLDMPLTPQTVWRAVHDAAGVSTDSVR